MLAGTRGQDRYAMVSLLVNYKFTEAEGMITRRKCDAAERVACLLELKHSCFTWGGKWSCRRYLFADFLPNCMSCSLKFFATLSWSLDFFCKVKRNYYVAGVCSQYNICSDLAAFKAGLHRSAHGHYELLLILN